MNSIAIKAEGISKYYRLGSIDASTLKQELNEWWYHVMHRSKGDNIPKNTFNQENKHSFWALTDVSFELGKGEILGIIGKNGAGKSTLLKVLSRVTKPTKGRIVGKGIVASLLEVGTGFHDDLTGRENIFLNGNILGMRNTEIKQKLDQIIAFSGIEKFIDTPVKRYSSGMYVRLAFAVAAHLEPEILIVDEVLSVGDAEFQKKCLGKMNDIAGSEGTTVIMVSHNMQAIKNLCTRAMLLEQGKLMEYGEPSHIINIYAKKNTKYQLSQKWDNFSSAPGNDHIRMCEVTMKPIFLPGQDIMDIRTPLTINAEFENLRVEENICIGIHLFTSTGDCIFDVSSSPAPMEKGIFSLSFMIPGNFLNDGSYYISIIFVKDTSKPLFYLEECISFELADFRDGFYWYDKWMGHVRPAFPVILKNITT